MEAIIISVSIEIQEKPTSNVEESIKVKRPTDIVSLKEVQAIKNAIQEHMLFIGLDTKNNVRNINIIGIGSSRNINIDVKEIVRLALINANDKIILVHNHPSSEVTPSKEDIEVTNTVGKLLKAFNIEMLDHIIVGDGNYLSMGDKECINTNFQNERTCTMENSILRAENKNLKIEIDELKEKINNIENKIDDDEMEF